MEESKRKIKSGQVVSYLLSPESNKAILVTQGFPLRKFADLGDEKIMLEQLAFKSTRRRLGFSNTRSGRSFAVLWNYLFYTFERLEEEDKALPDNAKKIRVVNPADRTSLTVFNTGLVDKQYRDLYAVFEEIEQKIGRPKWRLIGFCCGGKV